MASAFDSSVTKWLDHLKQGDQDAAAKLWKAYFDRLVRLARSKLGAAARRVADEEDVAVSVFDALCRGAASGHFQQLSDRDDLWRLLVAMTAKKAVDQMRREGRVKRGGGQVRGDSIFHACSAEQAGFDQFLGQEPSPSFLVLLDEQHRCLLERLGDEMLRRVAMCRIQGYANAEIAARLGISLRSVERKLERIRDAWAEELDYAG
jgi:DNA-directed RNA polymerase specialized sigma24 family protein